MTRLNPPTGGNLRRRVGTVIAAAVVIVGAWYAATSLGLGSTDMERLLKVEQASMAYPGSVLLASGGVDSGQTIEGDREASVWHRYGVQAAPQVVLDYFGSVLPADAWTAGAGLSVIGAGHEAQVCAWHSTGNILRVSVWKTKAWVAAHPTGDPYQTVYEVRVFGPPSASTVTNPCWKRNPNFAS